MPLCQAPRAVVQFYMYDDSLSLGDFDVVQFYKYVKTQPLGILILMSGPPFFLRSSARPSAVRSFPTNVVNL